MAQVRMKTVVQLRASAHCPSHARSDVSIRDLVTQVDEPEARGGTNTGPSPTETALAALIGCTNVIGGKCANKLGIDLGHLDIDAVCDFDRRGVTLSEEIDVPFEKVVLTVTCSGNPTPEQLNSVAIEVDKFCPLSKLYRQAGTVVETIWKTSAG